MSEYLTCDKCFKKADELDEYDGIMVCENCANKLEEEQEANHDS